MNLGLPVTYIGRKPYVLVEQAIEWLHKRGEKNLPPRHPGRPPKA